MKKLSTVRKLILISALSVMFPALTMCTSKQTASAPGDIPEIDVESLLKLPIEEFDYYANPAIADVEYFQPNDSILFGPYAGRQLGDELLSIDDDGVLVMDRTTGEILAKFNRKGAGPEEYVKMFGLAVDRRAKQCHVLTSDYPTKIKSYSFAGDYLGEIQLRQKVHAQSKSFSIYDDQYYFVAVNALRRILLGETDDKLVDRPYLLIDRKTGEIKQLPIDRPDPRISHHYVPKTPDPYAPFWSIMAEYVAGGENHKIVSEFSNDTIFVVENRVPVPLAVKTHWSKDVDSPHLVSMLYANRHYLIFEVISKTTDHAAETISSDENRSGTFIYDLKTGECHRYETNIFFESNGDLYRWRPLDSLMDDAHECRIKDRHLLDIIEKSDEESNWVWCIYHIAE